MPPMVFQWFFILLPSLSMVFDGSGPLVKRCDGFDGSLWSMYRVPQKKCPIAIFSLNLFQRSDYTFSHVFRNQSFEPVSSKHFKLLALSAATSSTASSANTLIYINLNMNYDKITRDVNEPFGFNIGCAILLNTTVLVYASRTTLRRSFRRWMIRKR